MLLTWDLSTNKSKEYLTESFQKLATKTTLYTLCSPEFLHWFEWGQEELQKFRCHQRHWQVSSKFSYWNRPLSWATLQASLSFLTHTRNLLQNLQISVKPGAHQQWLVLIDCRSAEYARTCLALVAWRFSGWLLGCEMTSATTLCAAAACKAQVTEVAQQHAVSIFVRQVLPTSCLLMDLKV